MCRKAMSLKAKIRNLAKDLVSEFIILSNNSAILNLPIVIIL